MIDFDYLIVVWVFVLLYEDIFDESSLSIFCSCFYFFTNNGIDCDFFYIYFYTLLFKSRLMYRFSDFLFYIFALSVCELYFTFGNFMSYFGFCEIENDFVKKIDLEGTTFYFFLLSFFSDETKLYGLFLILAISSLSFYYLIVFICWFEAKGSINSSKDFLCLYSFIYFTFYGDIAAPLTPPRILFLALWTKLCSISLFFYS